MFRRNRATLKFVAFVVPSLRCCMLRSPSSKRPTRPVSLVPAKIGMASLVVSDSNVPAEEENHVVADGVLTSATSTASAAPDAPAAVIGDAELEDSENSRGRSRVFRERTD